ncbi:MAG: YCF48-related protein, partial [Melioribacteraceae bacterium]
MRFLKISLFFFLFTITIYSQKGWEKQVSGTTEHLNGLYFIDTNHGFIVGNNGTLLRTTDSGTKWEKQSTGTSNDLSSISFVDLQNGFIWGSNKTFLRTKDGGATWHNLSDSLVDGIVPYAFLDANTALGVKEGWDSITVFKTINNGLSWERLS